MTPEIVDRWVRKDYSSTHQLIPSNWIIEWNSTGSTDPARYPLACREGVFAERAREAFLELAPKLSKDERFSDNECVRVGELAGVCAFETAAAAYSYGADPKAPYPGLFVEFDGEYVCPAPENLGVVARVIRPASVPMTAVTFKRRHNL